MHNQLEDEQEVQEALDELFKKEGTTKVVKNSWRKIVYFIVFAFTYFAEIASNFLFVFLENVSDYADRSAHSWFVLLHKTAIWAGIEDKNYL